MQIVQSGLTVANYCQAMERGEIVVNTDYQRSDQVWPPIARSFLIETILLNFPIPKMFLYQVTDLKSRRTYSEIVDGQQRSTAIKDFFEGRLRLSSSLELETAAGRVYDELDDDLKGAFINYGLSFDLFVGATPDQVREVFRRMNLFTVPLNPEEQRHAVFQGKFKWFVHRLARRYDDAFTTMGLFGPKQLVRMADTKLLTELAHAYIFGITTTKKDELDDLYRKYDDSFPEESRIEKRISRAFDKLIEWNDLYNTSLMKPHIIYSLVLAIMHVASPIAKLETDFRSPRLSRLDDTVVIPNLTLLAQALDDPEHAGKFRKFVEASSEKTNVSAQRRVRFVWLCKALSKKRI